MNIELLEEIAEYLEGDVDGAPDAGPSAKKPRVYCVRDHALQARAALERAKG